MTELASDLAALRSTSRAKTHKAPDDGSFLRSPAEFALHYLRTWPFSFGLLFGVALMAASCSVGVQYAMKLLVDAISGDAPDHAWAWRVLAVFIGLIAVESVLWRMSGWLAAKTTISVGVDIRLDLLGYMTGHPMHYFQNNLSGALGHRITAAAGTFGALTNRLIWDIAPPVINLLGAVIIFSTLDAGMTLALAVFALAITVGLILFGIKGRALHRRYAEESSVVGGELIDAISNIWSIKAFSARDRERARLRGFFSREADAQRRSWMYTEKSRILHDVLLWLMAGTILVWALRLWEGGTVTAGDVVVVSALTFRILHGSRDLAMALVDIAQHLAYLGETLRIIGPPHQITDRAEAKVAVPRGGSLSFRDVTFRYGGTRAIIEKLSFDVAPGEKVGIVGPSGAGKSTLLHLVQRLHDVEGGEILVDGHPLAGFRQDSLRAGIAVVPQDISLFHRSIRENIRFARPQASDAEVAAAARAAYCESFIEELPEGFDTLVGERGVKLSGGQRQRIAIARIFLKDAPIVLLDEATSSLDTSSELEVKSALLRLMRTRTVLAVAHRLSSIAEFDRILVLVGGRIVEDGPPEVLRRSGGVFARLCALQMEGLSIDEPEPEPSEHDAGG